MQDPDTPLKEAGSTNGAAGVVRKGEVVDPPAVAGECPVSARSIRESLPLPWITAIAPH
jgi:hypothetical protein